MKAFQDGVRRWVRECFGEDVAKDKTERVQRFVEEALELAQACGGSADDAHKLVDYVWGRPIGMPHQEAGGVLTTLAALCSAIGIDMGRAANDELARVWTKIEAIREKQRTKPHGSPLPEAPPSGLCECPGLSRCGHPGGAICSTRRGLLPRFHLRTMERRMLCRLCRMVQSEWVDHDSARAPWPAKR